MGPFERKHHRQGACEFKDVKEVITHVSGLAGHSRLTRREQYAKDEKESYRTDHLEPAIHHV